MQEQATAVRDGTLVAHGYGLKVYVDKGHLVVHHGIGRNRETLRLNRATCVLKRLFVIGHTGFVSLEALRWLSDVGAAFVHIGADGQLLTTSAPARHHESKLRRAQVLATDSDAGRAATVDLLRAKLLAQAALVADLAHLKATVRVKDAVPVTVADAILGNAKLLSADLPFSKMRELESGAGRNYWQTWARVAPTFDGPWAKTIPEHWKTAGSRTSRVDRKRARYAITPVHAILNYTYAILEVEATIASHAVGFDPSLGIMHADRRYRGSLASDLMEPCRPIADRAVLDLLNDRPLRRGDVFETRGGACRVGVPLARELAHLAPELRNAVAPHAEGLVRTLLGAEKTATPLTRRNQRATNERRVSRGAGSATC